MSKRETRTSYPKWSSTNLVDHFKKRRAKDEHCWRDVLALDPSKAFTQEDYEAKSIQVVAEAWLTFSSKTWDPAGRTHLDSRKTNLDRKLVKTVTSSGGRSIITCYHEHFDRRHTSGSLKRPFPELSLKYLQKLEFDAQGDGVRDISDEEVDLGGLDKKLQTILLARLQTAKRESERYQ